MDALTPPVRLLALPGKGLEVRDGAAVQDVPSEMDRKMTGQPRVLIENFLALVASKTVTAAVIEQQQPGFLRLSCV